MTDTNYAVTADELTQIVERIESLGQEKAALQDTIKEVFAEAKGRGYNNKAIREILKIRKANKADLEELQAIVELYKSAMNME